MIDESVRKSLEALLKRLDEEQRQIEEQRRALVMTLRYFEGLEQGYTGIAETPAKYASQPAPRLFPDDLHDAESQSRRGNRSIDDRIHEVLSERGPLTRRELYSHLEGIGVRIGGLEPLGNLSVRLSSNPRFVSIGGGQWDLIDRVESEVTETADDREDMASDESEQSAWHEPDQEDKDEEDSVPW